MPPQSIPAAAPFFIVFNLTSGHHDAIRVRRMIETKLCTAGRDFEIVAIDRPSELPEIARRVVQRAKECQGVVVAAGGDGTLNAVAQATLGSGCPFGVLPQGTFNYFSRAHGIPSETVHAVELLLSARAHPVQVGQVNERLFLVNASVGLYPELLEDREAYKQRFGRSRLVALASGLVTLFKEHRQLRLRIDHLDQQRNLRTPTLFVGNNPLQLAQIGLSESNAVVHGQLAAIALKPVSHLGLLWLMFRGAMGRLGEADSVTSFAFGRITVRPRLPFGARRVKVATDGEVGWMRTPLDFRVASQPLMLVRPEPTEPGAT